MQIFRAMLRMPSEQGWHKAFSTCLPHLAVVSLFVTTCMFAYLKPPSISSQSLDLVVLFLYSVVPPAVNPSISSPSLDLVVSFLYSVVPPAVNPLLYGLRNQELKAAVSNTYNFNIHKTHASLTGVSR